MNRLKMIGSFHQILSTHHSNSLKGEPLDFHFKEKQFLLAIFGSLNMVSLVQAKLNSVITRWSID